MNCWHCNRPASGICIFCGRGVCQKDSKLLPHIVSVYRAKNGKMKSIITENALFCGKCNPREEPIELEVLDKE